MNLVFKYAYNKPETNRYTKIRTKYRKHLYNYILEEENYQNWYYEAEEDIVVFEQQYLD